MLPVELVRWPGDFSNVTLSDPPRPRLARGQPHAMGIFRDECGCEVDNIEAGVKFGQWNGRCLKLFVAYHNGLNEYGQYYNEWDGFWSVGFWFDLW